MEEFTEITNLLKDLHDSPAKQTLKKIKMVEEQSAQLRELCDIETITSIQCAVEERMGPQMCDNSQQADRQEKNEFIKIFKDYEGEMVESQKRQSQMFSSVKSKLEANIQQLTAKYQQMQQKWEFLKEEVKIQMARDEQQMEDKLQILQSNPESNHIQSLLTNQQSKFELLYLEKSLSRRNNANDLFSLIVQLHLH